MFKESATEEEKKDGFFKYFNSKVKDEDLISDINLNTEKNVEQVYINGKLILFL